MLPLPRPSPQHRGKLVSASCSPAARGGHPCPSPEVPEILTPKAFRRSGSSPDSGGGCPRRYPQAPASSASWGVGRRVGSVLRDQSLDRRAWGPGCPSTS